MPSVLRQRSLRFVFAANVVSMMGSGMTSAAVTWYILQATRSEEALGLLIMLMTIPAMLMLPFTGVIIDREDRRYLLMLLDAARALIVLAVALLALTGRVQVWQLYAMTILVAAGFWMFWPTITALIQELSPEDQFVGANTFLLAGVQGGWLLAGALVGFLYNHIGLTGILFIDFGTYLLSFLFYLAVRKGRHVVRQEHMLKHEVEVVESAFARFFRELRAGLGYLKGRPQVVLLGASWSLFIGAMLTQGVIIAPLSDRIFHAGAVGFGWMNAGWAVGAFLSVAFAPAVIRRLGARRAIAVSMAVLGAGMIYLPFAPMLALAVLLYIVSGAGRGVGGVAISTGIMEIVPRHFMGRVQNTFYFAGTLLQLVLSYSVGVVSHRIALEAGFAMVGATYLLASLTAVWPMSAPAAQPATSD